AQTRGAGALALATVSVLERELKRDGRVRFRLMPHSGQKRLYNRELRDGHVSARLLCAARLSEYRHFGFAQECDGMCGV
ncbi:MAG: hypothetical protein ABI680_01330, partial [Chthoniobacteraceae bacterium]